MTQLGQARLSGRETAVTFLETHVAWKRGWERECLDYLSSHTNHTRFLRIPSVLSPFGNDRRNYQKNLHMDETWSVVIHASPASLQTPQKQPLTAQDGTSLSSLLQILDLVVPGFSFWSLSHKTRILTLPKSPHSQALSLASDLSHLTNFSGHRSKL